MLFLSKSERIAKKMVAELKFQYESFLASKNDPEIEYKVPMIDIYWNFFIFEPHVFSKTESSSVIDMAVLFSYTDANVRKITQRVNEIMSTL